MTGPVDRDPTLVEGTLDFYRQTLDWLADRHASLGYRSTHDPDAKERWNAV